MSGVEIGMRKGILLIGALVALSACSSGGDTGPEPVELTEEYGCGFGFYASNEDQTTGLVLTYQDFDGAWAGNVSRSGQIDAAWDAQLQFGTDLFANWCDDVLEPDEPTPEVESSWTLTGEIEVTDLPAAGQCGEAVASLHDVTAHGPVDQVLELGDLTITNTAWGCFAG